MPVGDIGNALPFLLGAGLLGGCCFIGSQLALAIPLLVVGVPRDTFCAFPMGSWAVAVGAVIIASIPVTILIAGLMLSNSRSSDAVYCSGAIGGLFAAVSVGLLIWG
jgi:hypothetical protein